MTNQLYFLYASLRDFLEPLRASLSSPEALESLFDRYGWRVTLDETVFGLIEEGSNVRAPLESFLAEAESLRDLLEGEGGAPRVPEVGEVLPIARAARNVFRAVSDFGMSNLDTLPAPLDDVGFWSDVGEHLLDDLLERYLRAHHPNGYLLLHLFGVIRYEPMELEGAERKAYTRTRFDWDQAVAVLENPLAAFRATYRWGDPEEPLDHRRLLRALEQVLRAIGLAASIVPPSRRVLTGLEGEPEISLDPDEDALRLTFLHKIAEGDGTVYEVGLDVLPAARSTSAHVTGLLASPVLRGGFDARLPLGSDFTLRWRTAADASALIAAGLFPDGVVWTGGSLAAATSIELASRFPSPRFLVGNERTARVELANVSTTVAVAANGEGEPEVSLSLRTLAGEGAPACRLVVPLGEADGFLKEVLPRDTLELGFGGDIVWSSRTGLHFDGSPTLQLEIPGTLKVGPVNVGGTRVGVGSGDRDARYRSIDLTAAANVSGKVGPVSFTVERMGFACRLVPYDRDELLNLPLDRAPLLGNLDLELTFAPPRGMGLGIDASGVAGGGALSFDPEKQEYAGVVQIAFGQVEVQAVGLITTRLPNEVRGFSMMVLVTAEGFAPLDLGLGFRLTGIGGLLGVNRTVAVDLLRAGLKNHTLDRLLFPEDPIRNAGAIVTAARRVFPPASGQHFVGPVVEISWGTGGLLTAELGVVLEFPSPLRLILLGQMRLRVPSPQKALVRINLDILGTADFDRGEALLLATLIDSRLLNWTVTGDAAFYLRWKGQPEFILAAGGFHPSFRAPAQLPTLERLAMSLSEGDGVRLRMQWYLALTANTLQHGSRVELHVSAIGFTVDGHLAYDALVHFDPFGFSISFSVGVGLKWHGHTLASVQLDGSLSGPSPWHVRGKAKFKIWIFSKSIDFDRTIGREEPLPPMPVVNPLPMLVDALRAPASWQAAPPGDGMVVTVREPEASEDVIVHPLGSLAVRQQVLPLGVPISRFGNARLARERTFRILRADLGDETDVAVTPILDHFAPGQFRELPFSQRLANPSFERMQAGVQVGTSALEWGGSANPTQRRDITPTFETAILDVDPATGAAVTRAGETYAPPADRILGQAEFGAAAKSPVRSSGPARFRLDRPAPPRSAEEEPELVMTT